MALTDLQKFWLLALLFMWAAFLFGGFVVGKLNEDGTHRTSRRARMMSSVMLAAAGWSWWLFASKSDLGGLAFFTALGMTLGLLGDLFMAGLIPVKERVLGGIGAFGLGHIAYIAGILNYQGQIHWGALLFWWGVALAAWFIVVFRGSPRTMLHYTALPYAWLLAATAGLTTGLALQNTAFVPMALGAALFLFSDLLLAAQLFNNRHFTLIGDVVWGLYGPGQMLIVFCVPLFVRAGAYLNPLF